MKFPSSLLLISIFLLVSCTTKPIEISGIVVDEYGVPLADAIVRIKTTENKTVSDQFGRFSIAGVLKNEATFVTAWVSGYYINGAEYVWQGDENIEIVLHNHSDSDNPDYEWLPSLNYPGQTEDQGCFECHSQSESDLSFPLPVDEWLQDAHSQAANNSRFISMYLGTDLHGNKSPNTNYFFSRDYGRLPLRPNPSQPYYGPGYKLDFPKTDGNCAACHAPLAAINDPYGVDPTELEIIEKEGISCDFCHKIWDVKLNTTTMMPYPNTPGVLSYEFRRPPEGHQFFAGPLDDVAPGEDTYSPIQKTSQFCSACHFAVFWDTPIYNSYGEWLESPYSNQETGKTCQDCHMPPSGANQFARTDMGGEIRNPETIFSHQMPGASNEELLQNAVNMTVDAQRYEDQITVEVTITNDQTGHHVPTDSPLRHLILLIEPIDETGTLLSQISGPIIPDWGGIGNPENGYYAGLPGKTYAKILQEIWTDISPSGAYWNPTQIISDNRLQAFTSDISTYVFELPSEGNVSVEVKLLFRRAFLDLMNQKGWVVPDIVMETETISFP